MCSSSTASTTAPRAAARSVSRIRTASSSAAAADPNDLSTWRDIWWRIVRNRPPPSKRRTSVSTPAYQAVNWSRRRASAGITGTSRAKPVSRAAQRGDEFRLEVVVDLAAQAADQHLEHVDEGIVVVVPHVRGDGGAVEHASRVQDEQLEQREFLGGERDRPAAATHLARREIDLQVRDANPRGRERRPAPRQRLEPRHELPKG